MKQPVGTTPITVPTVGVTETTYGVDGVIVGGLQTTSGPVSIEGRHAFLVLSKDQAEVLVRAIASKLGLHVIEARVHKAEPEADGSAWCRHCSEGIHVAAGGHGPTWVHSNSGAVAGSGAPCT
jgi:hypothetical protein